MLEVLGEDGRGESLWDFVVPFDGFVDRFELDQVGDWHEKLGLDNVSIVVDFNKSWLNKVSFSFNGVSSNKDLSTLLFDFSNTVSEFFNCALVVDWSEESVSVEWVASSNLWVSGNHLLDELIVNRFVDEDSSQSCASLSSSSDS